MEQMTLFNNTESKITIPERPITEEQLIDIIENYYNSICDEPVVVETTLEALKDYAGGLVKEINAADCSEEVIAEELESLLRKWIIFTDVMWVFANNVRIGVPGEWKEIFK